MFFDPEGDSTITYSPDLQSRVDLLMMIGMRPSDSEMRLLSQTINATEAYENPTERTQYFQDSGSFSSALANRQECNFCGVSGTSQKLVRCTRCKKAWYCGKVCQLADWKAHKKECNLAGQK